MRFLRCYSSSPLLFSRVRSMRKGEAPALRRAKLWPSTPLGKAIVITTGQDKAAMDVGVVIQPDTVLMVKGKKVPLDKLQDSVKVGDTVTVKYTKTNDLYAKEIVKK